MVIKQTTKFFDEVPSAPSAVVKEVNKTNNIACKMAINGNSSALLRYLEKLGRLPKNFSAEELLPLLTHDKEKTRILAVINLGKTSNINFLPQLLKVACNDVSTMARREATSAIGRMRHEKAIEGLIKLTQDADPKVVMQALRGLLAFKKKDKRIHAALEALRRHPNEIIQDAIECERTFYFDGAKGGEYQTESPDFMKNLVAHGDVINVLKKRRPSPCI